MKKHIHFIAIGGSAMHNLAIALHKKGEVVTGSDDEIFDPSGKRLRMYGLFPEKTGWFTENIHPGLDAVIAGMHAKPDNPELLKAKQLGIPVYSFPEYLYEHAREKTRVVIGGSHGKTTITSIILHIMKNLDMKTDYMVGAQLEGFDVMVRLSDDVPFMIMEGDEYPSGPTDLRPKFHVYKPHIAVISGIAWDHMNVFPTYEHYLDQFRTFIDCIEENGKLIYCADEPAVKALVQQIQRDDICLYPYTIPDYVVQDGQTTILSEGGNFPVGLFGRHNLLNIQAARLVLQQLGIEDEAFGKHAGSFRGASNRLEILYNDDNVLVIRDFAHAPSKLRATLEAVKSHFTGKTIVACMELHTYSSLNKAFLPQYKDTMEKADEAIVFYSPRALELKRLPLIDKSEVARAFDKKGLHVITDKESLGHILHSRPSQNTCFLFMSSGSFGGFDMAGFVQKLANQSGD
ncbi:MAG: peptidoglycan synthetase [Bacteroidia bacterium]|nr:MAG: peptidoglycan synthetase [Bacteroidia bacterium]